MYTLADAMPREMMEWENKRLHKLVHIKVVEEFYDRDISWMCKPKEGVKRSVGFWPGKQKNVSYWVRLASGHKVGWNENDATGWSFPIIGPTKEERDAYNRGDYAGWVKQITGKGI